MKHLDENTSNEGIAWFRRWFDSTYYHKLYSHQTDEEAKNFLENLVGELQPAIGSTMIDVGCGTGMHSKYLAAKGFQVTGIDLAFSNIKQAKKSENALLRFYRHDMRMPFGKENFDYVFNFFTSFGYFKNEREHTRVLENMSEALKPGGMLVLDHINHVYAEKNLVADECREIDGIAYNITRWADQGHIYKRITIRDWDMSGNLEHTEKIARFDLRHFDEMLLVNGLQIKEVYGDYNLSIFEEHYSPRIILVAGKPE